MSYSRWGSPGRWYCFWSAKTESKKRDDQLFEICEIGRGHLFSYGEMKKDLDKVLQEVKDNYALQTTCSMFKEVPEGGTLVDATYEETVIEPAPVSNNELKELKTYMIRFIDDVEEDTDLDD